MRINFHLYPKVLLNKEEGWWNCFNGGEKIYIRLFENEDFFLFQGSRDPIHGWYSPCYGKKVASTVMTAKKRGFPNEICFRSAICTEGLIDIDKIRSKFKCFDQ